MKALLRLILRVSEDFTGYMGEQLAVNQTDVAAMQYLITDGPMTPTQLAGKLELSTAATTVVADRLTKVGHVTREPHPTDRRAMIIKPAEESVAQAMRTLLPMIMVDVYRASLPPVTASG